MGYELNRLMKQYGVATPTMTPYSGTAMPNDTADANFGMKMANYEADTAAHEKYKSDYMNRIAGGSIYQQPQFQMKAPEAPWTGSVYTDTLKSPMYANNPDTYKPLVDSTYQTSLGRPAEPAGLKYWMNLLATGQISPQNFKSEIAKSMEANGGVAAAIGSPEAMGNPTTLPGTMGGGTSTSSPLAAIAEQSSAVPAEETYTYNNGYYTDSIGNRFLRDSDTGQFYPQEGGSEFSHGGRVRHFAQGGLNRQQRDASRTPQPMMNGTNAGNGRTTPGIGRNASSPVTPESTANGPLQFMQNNLNPAGANPSTPPTLGGPLPPPEPQIGGPLPPYQQPQTGGFLPQFDDQYQQQQTQPQTGGFFPLPEAQAGGFLPPANPYNIAAMPLAPQAPKAFARGGLAELDEMPSEGELLSLADIYGLSNPAELPMLEAPIQMASSSQSASDASPEGKVTMRAGPVSTAPPAVDDGPTGSTAEIIARGRAAVRQAQDNMRRGVQVDPSVYDDAAAAREASAARDAPVSTPPSAGRPSLEEMLKKYGASSGSQYAEQIRAARDKSKAEMEAFRETLQKAMVGEKDSAPSKAEMYFRLAAALASPTKTGGLMENLGLAAKELGDFQKDTSAAKKAARARNLELMLKGQELSMRSAKEDVDALQSLGAEESRDRRQVMGEMIKDYIKSGEPESAAGKQAKDEGLQPGTPEYRKRVSDLAQTGVDARLAQITSQLEGQRRADAKASLDREKFEEAKRKESEDSAKLTPKELEMKYQTEDIVSQADQALDNLQKAFALNPNTFDTSIGDTIVRKALENTKSDDPKVVATRQMENLLGRGALEKLRATFGGSPTEGERQILLSLEGIGSKSREERRQILLASYEALKTRRDREAKRLEDIKTGKYRVKDKPQTTNEGGE